MDRWPNLFIVGAPKTGTTSLYHYLNQIPDIHMSPIKEPNYFSSKTVGEKHPVKPIRDKKKYLKLFKNDKNSKYIGEASTSYLDDPESPFLIHKKNPESKILISLRDPVDRAYSNYLMFKENQSMNLDFHDQLNKEFEKNPDINLRHLRLQVGFYSKWVKVYVETFGKNQVKILIFEEFIFNPKHIMGEILKFLHLKNTLNDFTPEVHNPYGEVKGPLARKIRTSKISQTLSSKLLSKTSRKFLKEKLIFTEKPKPEMDPKDREILREFYYDDVQKLQKILGRELPWANFKN